MPSFLRIPKVQIAIALLLIFVSAIIRYPNSNSFYLLFTCVGFCVLADLLCTFLKKRVLFIPYAAIVTGLILTLIIDRDANWFQIAITTLVAMGIKNFLRFSGRHIFNPAASGLFISGLLFPQNISWWAVSFQTISPLNFQNLVFALILLSPLLISCVRLKKYYAVLAFLVVSNLASLLIYPDFSSQSILDLFFNPSLIFFALVMLPEPMTSPVNSKMQILYGIVVALISLFDSLIFGLLLGNLIFFKKK